MFASRCPSTTYASTGVTRGEPSLVSVPTRTNWNFSISRGRSGDLGASFLELSPGRAGMPSCRSLHVRRVPRDRARDPPRPRPGGAVRRDAEHRDGTRRRDRLGRRDHDRDGRVRRPRHGRTLLARHRLGRRVRRREVRGRGVSRLPRRAPAARTRPRRGGGGTASPRTRRRAYSQGFSSI